MTDDPKIFGVIVEWKCERALIMEGAPATYEEAANRISNMARDSRVIRVAVFRMQYSTGNEALIPKEEDSL